MNLKNKVFGFVAAAALTLSMVGGVAADTDSVEGSVTLAAGTCKVSIVQGNVDFGTWTWQGTAYAHTAGNNIVTLNASLQTHKPGGKCSGTITVASPIPSSHFTGSFTSSYGNLGPVNLAGLPGSFNFPAVGPGTATAVITLNSVPDTFAPDTYEGTVTVTAGPGN